MMITSFGRKKFAHRGYNASAEIGSCAAPTIGPSVSDEIPDRAARLVIRADTCASMLARYRCSKRNPECCDSDIAAGQRDEGGHRPRDRSRSSKCALTSPP